MNIWPILICLVLGLMLGSLWGKSSLVRGFSGYLVHYGVLLLILAMGARMTADEGVMEGLLTLGFHALVLAIGGIAGSVVLLWLFSLLWFKETSTGEKERGEKSKAPLKMTLGILGCVVLGGILGFLFFTESAIPLLETATGILLALLLLGVGVDIGSNKSALPRFTKKSAVRLLLVPLAVALGSIGGAVVFGALVGLAFGEAAAVGAGFGWYSLSAILITEIHGVELGTLAFATNILREFLAFLVIPIVARTLGGIVAIAPGGATTMDVTLPLIKEAGGQEVVVLAFFNGVVLSALVPILVPFLLKVFVH